jgi:hypothetical protein
MSGLSIKNVIFLYSKYSEACSVLLSIVDDQIKEWINFIQVDTPEIRKELLKGDIKEVPTCIVITADDSCVFYKGLERSRAFLSSLPIVQEKKVKAVPGEDTRRNETEKKNESEIKGGSVIEDDVKKEEYVPDEVKKRKSREKINLSEVLNNGAKLIEENERKAHPQPKNDTS